MRLGATLFMAATFVACTFDGTLGSGAKVACNTENRTCPEGFVCVLELGRCVSRTQPDREAPSVIATRLPQAPLRRGQVLHVEITVSEPLAAPPRASMTQAAASLALTEVPTSSERTFVFERTLGDDVAEGLANLSIDMVDVFGNAAQGVLIGAVTFDFTPPQATSVSVLGPRDPDGGVVVVRPGERVSLRVATSEPVRAGAQVTARSAACDAGFPFPPVASDGPLLDVSSVAAGPSGCAYPVALEGLVDLAGNVGPSPVPLQLELRVDGTPPDVTGLETLRAEDGGLVPAITFSRVAPYDEVNLRFSVDDSAASVAVFFDALERSDCGLAQCALSVGGVRRCACRWHVTPQDVEGGHTVAVTAADSANNARSASAPLRFDFTPPSVIPSTVQVLLAPPTGSLVPAVSALGLGGGLQVLFSFDEPGTARLASAPTALPFTLTAATVTSAVFAATLASPPAQQGPLSLTATVADTVGNTRAVPLAATLDVDTVAPAAPDVVTAGRILYRRVPWGRADAGPSFDVAGAAGSVEPSATVFVKDARDSEVGRTVATDAGAFTVTLVQADRAVVSVRAVDGAGNAGPSAEVRDVEWTATLAGKVLGSAAENPHRLELRRTFTSGLGAAGATEALLPASVAGAPGWVGSSGPPGSNSSAMTFDVDRRRILVFVSSTLSEWDGVGWSNRGGVLPPSFASRNSPGLAYDSRRKRVVLFGGITSAPTRELWEWDGHTWLDRTPASGGPSGRFGVGMVYDASRGRVVVFGGSTQMAFGQATNELWEWDGVRWENRTPTSGGPTGRWYHGMVYDSARQRTVVFSGYMYPGTVPNDLWEWDGTAWTQRPTPTTAPSTRFQGGMVYDARRGKVVVVGGNGAPTETWEWDGAANTWANRTTTSGLGSRTMTSASFDAARGVTVVFSGLSKPNDVWEWDGSAWSNPATGAAPPAARNAHALAYDASRRRTVLFGGQAASVYRNDVWEWDGSAWTARTLATPVPSARRFFSMAYDSARGATTLFGGDFSTAAGRELWDLNDAGWVNRTPASGGPAQRNGQVQAYDPVRGVTVMAFGSTGSYSGETWEWDGGAWANRTDAGGPAPRWRASACFDTARGVTLLFGGIVGLERNAETWEWNGSAWRNVSPDGGSPPARHGAGVACDSLRGKVVLFGGSSPGGELSDVWEWDGQRWQNETPAWGGPSKRTDSAMAYDAQRGRAVLFGGVTSATTDLGDTWEWALDTTARPGAVLHFPFSYASATGATVTGVELAVSAGARGGAPDGGVQAGAVLATYGVGQSFTDRATNAADPSAPQALQWSTTAPAELADLFVGPQAELGVAVVPQAVNGAAAPAQVSVTDAVLTVRYRRP